MTSLTFYGGVGEIGGNKILLGFEKNSVLLDFGISYRKVADFYEEFLQPRPSRGIYDYLALGIIPPLDIYNPALIPSDLPVTLRPASVDAVFLTHGHMDHVGNVGLLREEIPVISSPTTIAILKAVRDTGKAKLEAEVPYSIPRQASEEDPRIIESLDWKKHPYKGRDIYVTDGPSEDLKKFLTGNPGGRKLVPGKIAHVSEAGLDFAFQCYPVDHSVYGGTAYALETPVGWIVYTGDLRMHGRYREQTARFLEEASELDPKVLVIEGTRASRSEKDGDMVTNESEDAVYKTCLEAVMAEGGLVVADFAPRNCERLESFQRVAKETGRELVVLAKDAYLLDALACVDGKCGMGGLLVYKELKSDSNKGWERDILERYRERLVDPSEISKNPRRYILSLSFWDVKHLLDIRPEKGTYVYSSSEAHNEEQVMDFVRLWKWLDHFHMRVAGFRIEEKEGKLTPVPEREYHASGHASSEDLLAAVRAIDPEIVIPVHTEDPEFFSRNLKDYTVKLPEEGRSIEF